MGIFHSCFKHHEMLLAEVLALKLDPSQTSLACTIFHKGLTDLQAAKLGFKKEKIDATKFKALSQKFEQDLAGILENAMFTKSPDVASAINKAVNELANKLELKPNPELNLKQKVLAPALNTKIVESTISNEEKKSEEKKSH